MTEPDWATVDEMIDAARAAVSPLLWDGLCGGAGRETTVRRNAAALAELALVPRVLRGVDRCDLRTPLLGKTLGLPVVLAPVGEIVRFNPSGAAACAAGASAAGVATFVSVVAAPSLEDVRAASTGPLVLQIYMFGDRSWLRDVVERAERAGYAGICLTVDTATGGRRDRDLRNRLRLSPQPRPNLGSDSSQYTGASLTWKDVAWLREATSLPIVVKGIVHVDDARMAADHGVDVVYVSNHGGQQLDDQTSTIELVPEIVDGLSGRAEVVVDGGFTRGTDVIKALALGARAVGLGRLTVCAAAGGGAAGVQRMLGLLEAELRTSMLNLGAAAVDGLTPAHVRRTSTVAHAPVL